MDIEIKNLQTHFPAKDFGYDDEKRLQREFDDKRIRLQWNRATGQCEVWYEPSRSPSYCVYVIEAPYNICRAIRHLKDAQKSRQEQLEQYRAIEEARQAETDRKIKDISSTVADGAEDHYKGKVTVTV